MSRSEFSERVATATKALRDTSKLEPDTRLAYEAVVRAGEIFTAAERRDGAVATRFSLVTADDRAHLDTRGSIGPVELTAAAKKARDDFKRVGLEVQVFNTEAEVPDALRGSQTGFKAIYASDPETGKPTVLLVGENLRNARDARQAIEHEIIGHHAIEDLLGEDGMTQLRLSVADAAGRDPSGIGRMLEQVKRDYPSDRFSRDEQINEVVARMAEAEAPTRSMRNVLYKVRNVLTSLGFDSPGPMKLRDLQQMLREVSYSYRRGEDAEVSRFTAKGYAQVDQRIHRTSDDIVLQPTRRLDAQRRFSDKNAYLYAMLSAMKERNTEVEGALRSMDSMKALETGHVTDRLVRPIERALARAGESAKLTYDETRVWFDKYLMALHAPEVNAWFRLAYAPLKDTRLVREREATVNQALRGAISGTEARRWLEANIVDDALADGKWSSAQIRKAGLSNADRFDSTTARAVEATTRVMARSYTGWNPYFWWTMVRRDVPQAFWTAGFETPGRVVTAAKEAREAELGRPMNSAEKHEFYKAHGGGHVKVGMRATQDAAKAMFHVATNQDGRKLFTAPTGERKSIVDAWRSSGDRDLEARYKGDAEGLAEAKVARASLIEYFDEGGVLDFTRAYGTDPTARVSADPLATISKAKEAAESLGHKLDSVVQLVDNTRRFGVYTALVNAGVPKTEAAIRSRSMQDFNARGTWLNDATSWSGGYARAALLFTNANIQGFANQIERRMWRGGDAPIEPRLNADGTVKIALKSDWYKSLNWPLAMTLVGAAYAKVMLFSVLEGRDENGEDEARKHAIGTWYGTGQGGMQYGFYRALGAIGTSAALAQLGYADNHELGRELFNELRENLAPIGQLRAPQEGKLTDVNEWVKMFAIGFAPAALSPFAQAAANRDAFGTQLHRETDPLKPSIAALSGRTGTPDMWKDMALWVRQSTGGAADPYPETLRIMAKSFAGFPAMLMDRMAATAARDGDWLDYARALPTPLRVVAPPDWSTASWEGREIAKYRENTLKPMQAELTLARQLDQRDNPAIAGRGRNRGVGPRERALFEAHPELRDQLAAEVGYIRQAGALAKEIAVAKAAGENDRAQEKRLALKALQYRYVKAVRDGDFLGLRQLGQ